MVEKLFITWFVVWLLVIGFVIMQEPSDRLFRFMKYWMMAGIMSAGIFVLGALWL